MSCGLSRQLSLCLKVKSEEPDLGQERADLPLLRTGKRPEAPLGNRRSQGRRAPEGAVDGRGVHTSVHLPDFSCPK